MTDDEFVRALDRQRARMVRHARSVLGDSDQAEDAVQVASIRLWALREGLRAPGFSAYAEEVVKSVCWDELRKRKRWGWRWCSLDDVEPGTAQTYAEMVRDEQPGPEDLAMSAAERERLRAAFRVLPRAYRATAYLVMVECASYEEAARKTGAGMGTVRSRMNRARPLLRQALADTGRPG